MADHETIKGKNKEQDNETAEPVIVIRNGAIAASIWKRQSPSGYAYHDFSLSRSWKSMSTDKQGYSRNFFDGNNAELVDVIQKASAWITEHRVDDSLPEKVAA